MHVSQVFEGQEGDTRGIHEDLLGQLESSGIPGGNVFLWHPHGRAARHRPCAAGQRACQGHHVPVRHLPGVRMSQVLCVRVRHVRTHAAQWLLRIATANNRMLCHCARRSAHPDAVRRHSQDYQDTSRKFNSTNALTVRRSPKCSGSAGRRCMPCGPSLPARQPATPPASAV